jgi:hypothetical protein
MSPKVRTPKDGSSSNKIVKEGLINVEKAARLKGMSELSSFVVKKMFRKEEHTLDEWSRLFKEKRVPIK